jgi:hypothetical protein|mmetsp:Transcript_12921/g.1979  ORF Transcript_12921/g.1979 Transcript_12921/m.1979 type:complete len:109 (+) Transcript_12921:581-907(+)
MQPSESDIHADLIVSLDDNEAEYLKPVLNSLDTGSMLRFNATFMGQGDASKLHHLHGHGIEKLQGFIEIPKHTHQTNARYNIMSSSSIIFITSSTQDLNTLPNQTTLV